MLAYVPPHLRKPKQNNTKHNTRKVRFIGNATGNVNVTSHNARYSPRHKYAGPSRKILRSTKFHSINNKPVAPPTTVLFDMPKKFKTFIFDKLPHLMKKKTMKQRKN